MSFISIKYGMASFYHKYIRRLVDYMIISETAYNQSSCLTIKKTRQVITLPDIN